MKLQRINKGIRLWNSNVTINGGPGSPEGVHTANPGSIFLRSDGGVDTVFYQKVTGTGNTGWKAARTSDGSFSAEVTFAENGAGTYTGSVTVPAGATILDIEVSGVVLWAAATSATMKVGDVATDDGYFTGVNLKATDLLAGESISFALAGGKAGSYIANSQVSPRYSATARVISGIVTSVGAGTTGRTRMTVLWTLPTATAATQV